MAKKPVTPTTTAVVPFSDRLAALARKGVAQEAHVGGGSFISTRGGRLSYNDNPFPDNKMLCVVVDHVSENSFFEGRFDADNPTSPSCFAFFREEDEACPHEKSEAPQSEKCKGCPMNEFGTSDLGKGKACKNIRRLALITEDGLEDVENAPIAMLKLPVTSVKAWAGYVNQLANAQNLPPLGVVTEISMVPDSKTQFKLNFRLVEVIEDEGVLEALLNRQPLVEKDLTHPYTPNSERAAPTPPARGRAPVASAKIAPRGRR